MKIRVDDNGSIRLESNAHLSAEITAKLEKGLERKTETLAKMKQDYEEGKFDAIFKTL